MVYIQKNSPLKQVKNNSKLPELNDPMAKASRVLSRGIGHLGDFVKSSVSKGYRAYTGSIPSSAISPSTRNNGGGPRVINQGTSQERLVAKIINNNGSGGKVLNQGTNKETLRRKIK